MAPQASEFSHNGHNGPVLTAVRPHIHHSSAKTMNLRAVIQPPLPHPRSRGRRTMPQGMQNTHVALRLRNKQACSRSKDTTASSPA